MTGGNSGATESGVSAGYRDLSATTGAACSPCDFFTVGGEHIQTTRRGGNRREPDRRLPLPGTLLSRKWKGRTLLVEVLAAGFRYENRHYSSLSAIALAVTGTRWNGLAFFGLTRPAGEGRKERPCAKK